MGLRRFIVFGLILLIGMGLVIYTFVGSFYNLSFAGITLRLPVAVWMIAPAFILYVFTIFHLMFHGALGYARMKKIKNDSGKFLDNCKNALLGKVVEDKYKSDFFKVPGAILPLLNIDPKRYADYRIYDDGVQDILNLKRKIYEGEVVDLSGYDLREDNALVIKNKINKLEKDKKYAEVVLKRCHDKELCQKAHLALATYAPIDEINKYDIEPTRDFFDTLVSRVNAKDNGITISDEKMVEYISKLDYKTEDFIELAKKLKKKMNPDRLMLLFERLAHEFPHKAGDAYLYILFELQMIDHAREFLDNSSEEEYPKFKYLLFLKDSGKNFDTELFV